MRAAVFITLMLVLSPANAQDSTSSEAAVARGLCVLREVVNIRGDFLGVSYHDVSMELVARRGVICDSPKDDERLARILIAGLDKGDGDALGLKALAASLPDADSMPDQRNWAKKIAEESRSDSDRRTETASGGRAFLEVLAQAIGAVGQGMSDGARRARGDSELRRAVREELRRSRFEQELGLPPY